MANKTLNSRIVLRNDSAANWLTNKNQVLLKGEVGIEFQEDGTLMIKVGDGTATWESLPQIRAVADDVSAWAKAATKPTYAADEINGLAKYIADKIKDTNTTYQIIADTTDANKLYLQSKELGSTDWTTVSTFTVSHPTLTTGSTNGTVSFNGRDVAVKGLGSAAYTASTAYDPAGTGAAEAKKVKDAVVNSVAATANKGIEIGGTATAPTIGIKLDSSTDNKLTLGANGLKVTFDDQAVYSITKDADSGSYAAIYHLTKDGTNTGVAINIPKDMVVSSGTVETNPSGQAAGTYLVLTLANATSDKVYINVGSLIEYVTSGSASGDQIQVVVSSDHKVAATLSNGSVTKAQLVSAVQTSLGKADTALQSSDVSTIGKTGNINDIIQTSGDTLVLNGGTASTVI